MFNIYDQKQSETSKLYHILDKKKLYKQKIDEILQN